MTLLRWIGVCSLLILIAAAGIALSRNPSSVLPSSSVAVDAKTARAANAVNVAGNSAADEASGVGNASSAPGAINVVDTAPTEAGMMAYIDPETGELTTGPAPASDLALGADLENALRRDDAGLEVVKHADGSKSLNLQGRYQHVSIVRIDENGVLSVCTDDAASVAKSFQAPASHPATPEVK